MTAELLALKTAPVLAAIEQHGMQTTTASDIAAVAEHFGLDVLCATITDKHITGAMLLQVSRVSDFLLELDVDVQSYYFAVAALVGVVKYVDARCTLPAVPLAAVAGWMRGQDRYADMADAFQEHGVLEIAVPLLEPALTALVVGSTTSRQVKDLIADFNTAHVVLGWMVMLDCLRLMHALQWHMATC